MENEPLTMYQASTQSGVPSRHIRSYCNWGLIKHIRHNRAGRRIFNQEQLELIALLYGLQKAGLTKTQLKQYINAKDDTLKKALLATQKRQLWQEITERQQAIDFIERQEDYLQKPTQV